MKTSLRTRWIVGAFALFAMASFAGLAFGTMGPIAVVRGLGWLAMFGAAIGCLLQLILLHEADATAFSRLHAWLSSRLARMSAGGRFANRVA